MLQVLNYIFKNNSGLNKVKFLISGLAFQVFKRVTGKAFIRKLFNGKKIAMYPNCNVSTMFAYTNIPDEKEIRLLRSLIKGTSSPHFIDIGANIGSYSVCVMDICTNIDAFEPHPFTVKRTKNNFRINNVKETLVHEIALSSATGKTRFTDIGSSSSENRIDLDGSIEVEMNTLDEFSKRFNKKDEFILKIDVEGYELEILKGAKRFLANFKIIGIIFECFNEDEVFAILKSYGFNQIDKISENNYFAAKNQLG